MQMIAFTNRYRPIKYPYTKLYQDFCKGGGGTLEETIPGVPGQERRRAGGTPVHSGGALPGDGQPAGPRGTQAPPRPLGRSAGASGPPASPGSIH